MVQNKEDKARKKSVLRGVLNRVSFAALLTAAALGLSKPSTYEREEDEGTIISGIGWVPRDLHEKGISDLEIGLASAINRIYLLSQNYDQNRLVSKSDVPLDIAMRVGMGWC